MPTIPPDAIVNGVHNGPDAQLTLDAMLWCLRGDASGWISGQLTILGGATPRHLSFESHTAVMVHAMDDWISRGVGASFTEVSIQEENFTPARDCRIFFTAVSDDNGVWTGSLTIVYPDEDRSLFVFGLFAGSIQVIRQVKCRGGDSRQEPAGA